MKLAIGRVGNWFFPRQIPDNLSAQEIADFLARERKSESCYIDQILVISVDNDGNPVISRELLLDEDYV